MFKPGGIACCFKPVEMTPSVSSRCTNFNPPPSGLLCDCSGPWAAGAEDADVDASPVGVLIICMAACSVCAVLGAISAAGGLLIAGAMTLTGLTGLNGFVGLVKDFTQLLDCSTQSPQTGCP